MNSETENIKQELRLIGCSQLAAAHSLFPIFFLANDFFAKNEDMIKEKGELFPFSNENVYQLPENYFEDLGENIVFSIEENDDKSAVPNILNESDKVRNPYQVPRDYFDKLHLNILKEENEIIEEKSQAKLVSIFRNLNKYVAAAVILVLFSVGSNFFLRMKEMRNAYNSLKRMDINHELADIPTEEILNYLNTDKKIAHFTEPNAYNNPLNLIAPENSKNSSNNLKEQNSDHEIFRYLNQEDPVF